MIRDFNKLSKEIFEANRAKGFHDEEQSNETLLMLVITELSEAVEADRRGRIADLNGFNKAMEHDSRYPEGLDESFEFNFQTHIKDTVEDELAAAVIRLLNLAGLRGYAPLKDLLLCPTVSEKKTFPENIFAICKDLIYYKYSELERVSFAILNLEYLCRSMKVDLWKHVELKLRYNSLRAYKHGKKY